MRRRSQEARHGRGLASLAVASLALSACNSPTPPSIRRACLAESAAGDTLTIGGYSERVLEDATRKAGGRAAFDGHVLTLTTRDALTGRSSVVGLEMTSATLPDTSDQCGPGSLVISRLAVDGQEAGGLDMQDIQDIVFPLVTNSAHALGLREPKPVTAPSRSTPPKPISLATATSQRPELAMSGRSSAVTAALGTANTPPAPAVTGALAPRRADPGGYSAEFQACMAAGQAAQGVTWAILDCHGEELRNQDVALNRTYREALERLTADQGVALRADERLWIKDRDTRCEHRRTAEGGDTLSTIVYAQCVLDETVKRTTYLAGR